MCVIMLVLKKENDEKLNEAILNNAVSFSNYNNDGLSILAMSRDKNKEPLYYRGLDYDYETIKKAVYDYDFINYHARTATKGKKSVDNCHLWKRDNWIFSHNGMISDMGNDEMCDSLDFFNTLFDKKLLKKDKIKYESIQQYISDSRFTGRCVIYNIKQNKAYLFSDFKCFALNRNYLAICSAEIDTESSVSLFNVRFDIESDNENIEKLEGDLSGVHLINYNTEKIYQLAEEKHYYGNYNGYGERIHMSKKTGLFELQEQTIDEPTDDKKLLEMTDDEIEAYYKDETSRHKI